MEFCDFPPSGAPADQKHKNLRCIITTLEDLPKELYEYYCLRGDMENRIKELKLDCYSGRTSCHGWEANQFRLLLSSYAYILLDSIRRLALKNTNLFSPKALPHL